MKIKKYIILIILILVSVWNKNIFAQYSISNGVSLPASDTVRALIVFVQVDFSTGGCPSNLPDNINGSWPEDSLGKRLPPADADSYFDFSIPPYEKPKEYITKFYHQASFGNYVLLGDYYPEVLTIPCNKIIVSDEGLNWVLDSLNKRNSGDTTIYTVHGLPLNAFDKWTITKSGLPKIKKPDGKIDLLYIIWRNNRFLYGVNTKDISGFGVHSTSGKPFKNMKGVNNVSSYNAGTSGSHGYFITIAEHLHAIFGGNNWHTANGRGEHTFLATSDSYSVTGQAPSTMLSACGWDRWMMNWKNPDKKFLISALNENNEEVNTELITIDSIPNGGTFILRDFMTTGDALRVKLPHINWEKKGDVKNQYLWIENRRMNPEYENYYTEDCADNNNGKFPNGTPGIYVYVQVGKDLKQGGEEIFNAGYPMPNSLGSFLFPLTAEGSYDFSYAWDKIQEPSGTCGNWGNRNLPIDKAKSKPNPFTGFSDLYEYVDSNNDGKLYSGDDLQSGLSEVVGDTVIHYFYSSGDWQDAFCKETGNIKLSLSSNPAPVTVYTQTTNYEAKNCYLEKGKPASFENRTIWLNGLSAEILDENVFGNGEMKIKIRWDDYNVSQNVRWCGNIALSPNDFDTLKPSLILEKNKTILLDRGYSPTKISAIEKDINGRYIFTDSTVFTCLKNSFLLMNAGSEIIIDNGSRLILEAGSMLQMTKNNKIILRNGGDIKIKEGAVLKKGKKCIIVKKKNKQ